MGKAFKEIMTQNFPKLLKGVHLQAQGQQTPHRMDLQKFKLRPIKVDFRKS